MTLAAKAATRAVGATEAWDPRRYALVPREDLVLRGVAATYHLEQHRDPEPVATLVAFTLSVSAAARPTHAQSELYRTFLPVAAAALAKAKLDQHSSLHGLRRLGWHLGWCAN